MFDYWQFLTPKRLLLSVIALYKRLIWRALLVIGYVRLLAIFDSQDVANIRIALYPIDATFTSVSSFAGARVTHAFSSCLETLATLIRDAYITTSRIGSASSVGHSNLHF